MYRPYERRVRTSSLSSALVDATLRGDFTDRLSNAISLSQSEAANFLTGAEPAQLADRHLLLFLHEATHHASFANLFGAAMSALAISSSGQAGIPGRVPRTEWDLFLSARDYLMLRWTETVYAPLIEGTALFAEYDLYWGRFAKTSHALLHAIPLFLLNDVKKHGITSDELAKDEKSLDGTADLGDLINPRLAKARMKAAVEQKEFLLGRPLIPEADDQPYLLGYLAIKRAYLTQRKRFEPLGDVDLFLITMCGYWFADSELSELLLSLNDSHFVEVQNTLVNITEHFQNRWESFFISPKKVTISVNSIMEEHSANNEAKLLPDLSYSARVAPFEMNAFTPKFVKHRLALRYAMTPVDIECSCGHAIIRGIDDGSVLGQVLAVPSADVGQYPGTIECVRSYLGDVNVLVILGPSGLIAVKDMISGDWNLPQLIEQFDDLPSLEHVGAMAISASRTIWSYAFAEGDKREMYEHQIGQSFQIRDSVHLQVAFPGANDLKRRLIVDTLVKVGFCSLFGTGYRFRQLARYSVVFGGPGTSMDIAAASMKISTDTLQQELIAFNTEANSILGVDLFEIVDRHVTSAI